MNDERNALRRRFLAGLAGMSLAGLSALPPSRAATQELLEPTPACDDDDEPTPEQTAGPFYIPNSPQRSMLREGGMIGTPVTLAGYVLSTGC